MPRWGRYQRVRRGVSLRCSDARSSSYCVARVGDSAGMPYGTSYLLSFIRSARSINVFSLMMTATATFASKAGLRFRRGHLALVFSCRVASCRHFVEVPLTLHAQICAAIPFTWQPLACAFQTLINSTSGDLELILSMILKILV